MAITQNTYTGNGSTTLYSFTFPYLDTSDIKVTLNGVLTTAYTLANATTIQFNTPPANGVAIIIFRNTDIDNLNATFFPGSAIRAQDLNNNFLQSHYAVQEVEGRYLDRTGGSMSGQLDMDNNKIVNLATPTANGDAVTKSYVDTAAAAKVSRAGDSMTGALAMGSNKVTGVADPTSPQDAATKNYVDTADSTKVSKAGDTMTGALAMGTNKITGLGTPTLQTDAATKNYVDVADGLKVSRSGDTMSGNLDMGNNKVISTSTPTNGSDLTNKTYVDGVTNNGVPTGDKGDITVTNLGATWTIDNGVVTPAKLSTGGPTWTSGGGLGINNVTPILAEGLSFTDTLPSSFAGANRISFGQSGGIVRNGIGVSGSLPGTIVSYIADGRHAFYNYQFGTLQQVAQLDQRLMLGGVGTYSFAGTTRLVVQGNNANDTTEGIIDLIRGSNAITGNVLGRIQFRDNYATPQSYYASISCVAESSPSPFSYSGSLVFSTNNASASPTERMRIKHTGTINFSSVPVYADNSAATTGGLAVGDMYRTSTGQLMIRY